MKQKVVTVLGGTGFIGRYVVRQLAAAGYTIRVICRNPNAAAYLKPAGYVGQIVIMKGDLAEPQTLADKIAGSWAVVNLVGILYECGKQRFNKLQALGPERIGQLAKAAGVERVIHISALGVDKAKDSIYARTKLQGEKNLLTQFPAATILRPSVVFGPEDNFFNQFARMAVFSPVLPLIGGGKTRFQPVYAGDVARAVAACLERADSAGQTYELGGPRTYSFRELMQFIMDCTGKRRPLVPIPFFIASLIGLKCQLLRHIPLPMFKRPTLTRDQVRLLRTHNIVSTEARNFMHLGITPAAVEMVVPDYLSRYNPKQKAPMGAAQSKAA